MTRAPCAVLGKPAALAALIEAGADVRVTERTGATALHLAASKGYDESWRRCGRPIKPPWRWFPPAGALVLWLCAVVGRRVRGRAR